jgi:hypothetical protein
LMIVDIPILARIFAPTAPAQPHVADESIRPSPAR